MKGYSRFLAFLFFYFLCTSYASAFTNDWLPFTPFYKPAALSLDSQKEGFSVETTVGNHYSIKIETDDTFMHLDYEKYAFRLNYQRKLKGTISVQTTLPIHIYSGGSLDSSISEWHQYWEFHNSNRDRAQHNQFLYRLSSHSKNIISIDSPPKGIGDVSFKFFTAKGSPRRLWSPVAILSLPTGDHSKLLGLGKISGAVGLQTSQTWKWGGSYVQAFLMPNTLPKVYKDLDSQLSYQLDTGARFSLVGGSISQSFSLYRSPLKDTGIEELDNLAVLYYTGLHFKKDQLTLFFQEDLSAAGGPDFTIGIRSSI